MAIERLKTGNSNLDEVLHGGFPLNTINVVMGAPGSGKTILAEQLVFANATQDSPALYLTTLSEPLDKFIQHGQSYSFFDSAKVSKTVFYEDLGMLVRERGIGALAEIVAEMLTERKPRLIVIDSFKALNELIETPQDRRTILFGRIRKPYCRRQLDYQRRFASLVRATRKASGCRLDWRRVH